MIDIRHHSSGTLTACLVSKIELVTAINIFNIRIEDEAIRFRKELLPFNDALC